MVMVYMFLLVIFLKQTQISRENGQKIGYMGRGGRQIKEYFGLIGQTQFQKLVLRQQVRMMNKQKLVQLSSSRYMKSNGREKKNKSLKHDPGEDEAQRVPHEKPTKKEELFFEKFKCFLKTSQEKKLIDKIVNFYGKNFEISYQERYNFRERWEKKPGESQLNNELLQELHPVHEVLCFFTIIFNVYAIWALSVSRYFGVTTITDAFPLYELLLALKISQGLAKFLKKYWNQQGESIRPKSFIISIHKELLCAFYFLYLVFAGASSSRIELIIELLITYFLWKQSALIYQKFKVSGWAIRYENQIKIFELLFNIFIQAHFFAILMFLSANIIPEHSWTDSMKMNNSPLFTQYVYSYYFACTTILTIGYGDITPQDEAEVLVVILIEIIGVLSFGYLLNEMGHTLSKMRNKQEELEKDLQTVSKMAKYYNLQKKLQNKAKHFLLNNQIQTDSLKPSDENGLFMKLNDDLRTEINNQNSLSIIKSCIFFLCHWTKGFQTEIARRLEKRLMSPTESLGECGKLDRVFIIKQGTVEVYLNRFGSNQSQKKLLKTIMITPLSEVTDNIYGYTAAISNRPVYLHAVAKDFTATYSISKADFLQCVNLDSRDFQYYHEIKCRIDQAPFCEEWEVPAINNIREHYSPSKFFLIKKNKIRVDSNKNQRKHTFDRKQRKKYLIVHKMRLKCEEKEGAVFQSERTLEFQNITLNFTAQKLAAIHEESESKFEEEESNFQNVDVQYRESSESIESDSQSVAMEHARDWIRAYKTSQGLEQNINKQKISSIFEHQKVYLNFFPRNNISNVLLKFEGQNCMEKRINLQEPTQPNIILRALLKQ